MTHTTRIGAFARHCWLRGPAGGAGGERWRQGDHTRYAAWATTRRLTPTATADCRLTLANRRHLRPGQLAITSECTCSARLPGRYDLPSRWSTPCDRDIRDQSHCSTSHGGWLCVSTTTGGTMVRCTASTAADGVRRGDRHLHHQVRRPEPRPDDRFRSIGPSRKASHDAVTSLACLMPQRRARLARGSSFEDPPGELQQSFILNHSIAAQRRRRSSAAGSRVLEPRKEIEPLRWPHRLRHEPAAMREAMRGRESCSSTRRREPAEVRRALMVMST